MFIDFFGIAQQVRKFFAVGKHSTKRQTLLLLPEDLSAPASTATQAAALNFVLNREVPARNADAKVFMSA